MPNFELLLFQQISENFFGMDPRLRFVGKVCHMQLNGNASGMAPTNFCAQARPVPQPHQCKFPAFTPDILGGIITKHKTLIQTLYFNIAFTKFTVWIIIVPESACI